MRASVLALVALTAGLAAAGDAPPTLPNIDPLLQPAPKLEAALQYTPDTRPVAEKIVPLLHQKLGEAEPGDDIKVIVTLVDPEFNTKALPGSAEHDAVRARHIAALEHEFVVEAMGLGFQASRGLKHSPVVSGILPRTQLDPLASLPLVQAVEHDFRLEATLIEGGNLIRSPQLRSQGGLGHGIGVAVVDSGIDWHHSELNTRVTAGGDFTGTQSSDQGFDDTGHGTSCAGIIAGANGGMAPQAHLWAMKVLDSSGLGQVSYQVSALDSVYEHRNDFGGVRVVNMSVGGSAPINYVCDADSPSMTQTMSRLISAGIAVFVSSGNDGCTAGISFPACVSHAISVGAVYDANIGSISFPNPANCNASGCNDSTTAADQVTCYSNSGVPLDILAPSHCANTSALGGGVDPCFGGTSAAAPYASGVAAQIFSLRPTTTPAELRTALKSTGRPVTDPWNGLTRRRIDAQAAYQHLAGTSGGSGTCTNNLTNGVVCLRNKRFEFTGTWTDFANPANTKPLIWTPVEDINATGGFQNNPSGIQVVMRVADGCSQTGTYWVWLGGFTDAGWSISVRDTTTGRQKTFNRTRQSGAFPTTLRDATTFTCN